jgi:hypothetical protein
MKIFFRMGENQTGKNRTCKKPRSLYGSEAFYGNTKGEKALRRAMREMREMPVERRLNAK